LIMVHRFSRFSGTLAVWVQVGLLLGLWTGPLVQPATGATVPTRVVAVGDIHGDFDALVSILRETGIIDAQHNWSGGSATLVQTGDFLDRGAQHRQVMDLFMTLEEQAAAQNGRVVVLLGNHEMMNLMGDLRYVSPQVYSSFVDGNSEQRGRKAYQDYLELLKKDPEPEFERIWMQAHPPGFFEYREALDPEGEYGRWLRERPAVLQIADTLFLHGGIHPDLTSLKVEEMNQRVKSEIQAFDRFTRYMVQEQLILPFFALEEIRAAAEAELERGEGIGVLKDFLAYGGWLSNDPEGPLWFRGFARWSEEEGRKYLPDLLEAYHAKHFVVGHTPQFPGGIRVRFGGKIFLIDTGLSSVYTGGRASALEIREGKFTAIYLEGRQELQSGAP
jgi:hypothetical protein